MSKINKISDMEGLTMKQICQMGFSCPYKRWAEGDELCIYPYIFIPEDNEDMTFGFPEDGDCPLLKWDSELYDLLYVYQNSEKVKDLTSDEKKRLDEEDRKIIMQLHKDVFGDD